MEHRLGKTEELPCLVFQSRTIRPDQPTTPTYSAMDFKSYAAFTTEDFLLDDHFLRWALNDPGTATFWDGFLLAYPEKKPDVLEARRLARELHAHFGHRRRQVSPEQVRASFQRLSHQLDIPVGAVPLHRRTWLRTAAAAAAMILLAFAGRFAYTYWTQPSHLVFTTGNGERRSFELPDGSSVQLNANSELRLFPDRWQDTRRREVWLHGEAYFEVLRKAAGTKFVVHADAMEVSVLGTQFNVRTRSGKTDVVLAEGKVQLAVARQKITMQPGDMVSYSATDKRLETRKVKPIDHTAWKDGIIVFNSPFGAVAEELEALYGVSFHFQDEDMKRQHIQLSAPADNLDQVLEILELVFPEEISVQPDNGRIMISRR